jgi:hypothetical protein
MPTHSQGPRQLNGDIVISPWPPRGAAPSSLKGDPETGKRWLEPQLAGSEPRPGWPGRSTV